METKTTPLYQVGEQVAYKGIARQVESRHWKDYAHRTGWFYDLVPEGDQDDRSIPEDDLQIWFY